VGLLSFSYFLTGSLKVGLPAFLGFFPIIFWFVVDLISRQQKALASLEASVRELRADLEEVKRKESGSPMKTEATPNPTPKR
jgi:hypothetical protein